ncbi:hypothetical protein K458DRAFT_393549 [Lentithecium fluviatile CBS 122367]|uniref:RRM domain-containing protein n=1 Tax=Lentithecium fluviatile CBS 122367 TaxID=1168545 RepID=A0A6G1IP31_9PLEO|nr:hypothetical protein K458DRAFT_393549 [Lentithecium fluviatile CBS 122367]
MKMPRGTKVSLGDISKPEHRVLRLGNLHSDATDAGLRAFFDGFDVLDWKLKMNVKSGKLTIAYVLMSTMQELFRAERELDSKELFGRPVRILRAKAGFKITKEGLLNDREAEKKPESKLVLEVESETLSQPGSESESEPVAESSVAEPAIAASLIADQDASPLTEQTIPKEEPPKISDVLPPITIIKRPTPATEEPRTAPSAAAIAKLAVLATRCSRKKPGPSTEPANRVLYIGNIHPEANLISINLFFGDNYDVTDFMHRRNPQTNKSLGFGFVMVGSMEERNLAVKELQGKPFMGRGVKLEAVPKVIRVDENGFMENPSRRTGRRGGEPQAASTQIQFGQVQEAEEDEASAKPSQTSAMKHIEGHQDPQYTVPAVGVPDPTAPGVPEAFWPSSGWNGPKSFPTGQDFPTWDINLAYRFLKSWNLVGKDSEDKEANMVTEEDWYCFQLKEVAKYKKRKLGLQ